MKSIKILSLLFSVVLSSLAFSQEVPPPTVDSIDLEGKIFERVEVEASYPGGSEAWIQYLMRNINGGVAADNGAPAGKFTVVVQFIVDKEGKLSDFKALTKLGYGMEQEVIKILQVSGLWTPAIQNGKPVKAYRKQPVTFQVEDDDIDFTTKVPYVFFSAIDNQISISVKKVKAEDLRATISQGSIVKKGDGQFTVKVSKPGRVIVRLYDKKDKEVGTMSFEVREK